MSGRERHVMVLVGSLAVVAALATGCGQSASPGAEAIPSTLITADPPNASATGPQPSTSATQAHYAAPAGTLCDALDAAAIKDVYPSAGTPSPAPTATASTPAEYACTVTLAGGTASPAAATLTVRVMLLAHAQDAQDAYHDEQAGYALNLAGTDIEELGQAVYYDVNDGRVVYVCDGNLVLVVQLAPNPRGAMVDAAVQDLIVRVSRSVLDHLRQP